MHDDEEYDYDAEQEQPATDMYDYYGHRREDFY